MGVEGSKEGRKRKEVKACPCLFAVFRLKGEGGKMEGEGREGGKKEGREKGWKEVRKDGSGRREGGM